MTGTDRWRDRVSRNLGRGEGREGGGRKGRGEEGGGRGGEGGESKKGKKG